MKICNLFPLILFKYMKLRGVKIHLKEKTYLKWYFMIAFLDNMKIADFRIVYFDQWCDFNECFVLFDKSMI